MSGERDTALGEAERLILVNALNEILHGPDAIEEWEFPSRIGVDRSEALDLFRRLSSP